MFLFADSSSSISPGTANVRFFSPTPTFTESNLQRRQLCRASLVLGLMSAVASKGWANDQILGVPFDAPEKSKAEIVSVILSDRSPWSMGIVIDSGTYTHSPQCLGLYKALESGIDVDYIEPEFKRTEPLAERSGGLPDSDRLGGTLVLSEPRTEEPGLPREWLTQCNPEYGRKEETGPLDIFGWEDFGKHHFKVFGLSSSAGRDPNFKVVYSEDEVGGHFHLFNVRGCKASLILTTGSDDYVEARPSDGCVHTNINALVEFSGSLYVLGLTHGRSEPPCDRGIKKIREASYRLYIAPVPTTIVSPDIRRYCMFSQGLVY